MNDCYKRMFEAVLGVDATRKGLHFVGGDALLCGLVEQEIVSLRNARESLSRRLKEKEQLCMWRPTVKEQWAMEHPEEWGCVIEKIRARGREGGVINGND